MTAAVPTLNHVAMSMDPAVLDEQGRADVLSFYGEVFGWSEGDNTGERGNPLILYTGAFAQFIYLLPGDPDSGEHMHTPPLDHFGLQVQSLEQLHEILGRAKAYAERDDRVRIIDVDERITHGPAHDYILTNAYIGFLLPLMVELQHLDRRERAPA
jgi:hypothetical protein